MFKFLEKLGGAQETPQTNEAATLREIARTPDQQTAAELFSASSEFLEKLLRA